MIVRELLTRLGFRVDESGIRRFENRTDGLATKFRNLAVMLGGFTALKGIAHVADQMQSLRVRIGELPQTVGDVGTAFDAVGERAMKARQSVEAYSAFYYKAGNATQDFIKDQEDVLKIVDGAAFGLAASGADAVRQKQAFFQLGQAIGSPAVQMEEMNTLIDVAPDLFRELGKTIPGANNNLKDFIGTGQVSGRMLAEGLIKVMPKFRDEINRMPLTIGQATVMIQGKFGLMVDKMVRKTMIVSRIATIMLDSFGRIEKGIDWLIDKVGGSQRAIELLGNAVIIIAAGIAISFSPAILVFAKMALIVAALSLLIQDFMVWINGGNSVIGEMIGPWSEWRDTVMSAVNMVMNVLRPLWNLVVGFAQALKALWQGDPAAYAAAIGAIFEAFSRLLPAIGNLLWGVFKGALAIIWTLFKNTFSLIAGMIGTSLQAAWNLVYGGFAALLSKLYSAFAAWVKNAAIQIASLIPGGKTIMEGIVGGPGSVGPQKITSKGTGQGGKGNDNITNNSPIINQNFPHGTSPEIAAAARRGAKAGVEAANGKQQSRAAASYGR